MSYLTNKDYNRCLILAPVVFLAPIVILSILSNYFDEMIINFIILGCFIGAIITLFYFGIIDAVRGLLN